MLTYSKTKKDIFSTFSYQHNCFRLYVIEPLYLAPVMLQIQTDLFLHFLCKWLYILFLMVNWITLTHLNVCMLFYPWFLWCRCTLNSMSYINSTLYVFILSYLLMAPFFSCDFLVLRQEVLCRHYANWSIKHYASFLMRCCRYIFTWHHIGAVSIFFSLLLRPRCLRYTLQLAS